MSYDIDLFERDIPACPHCGRGYEAKRVSGPDPTYNLMRIFDLALTGESFPNAGVSAAEVVLWSAKVNRPRGLEVLSGKVASETIPILTAAIARLHDPKMHVTFKELEPSNKWGDLDGARRTMATLLEMASENPALVWRIR